MVRGYDDGRGLTRKGEVTHSKCYERLADCNMAPVPYRGAKNLMRRARAT